jgi:hypothetical protein
MTASTLFQLILFRLYPIGKNFAFILFPIYSQNFNPENVLLLIYDFLIMIFSFKLSA